MLLPVSAPFHCALMQPAAEVMAEALAKVIDQPPVVPVVANVLAKPISDPAEIVRRAGRAGHRHGALARVGRFHGGRRRARTFYEVGAGKVLSGLIKRIAEGATASAIGTPDDVAAFKAADEANAWRHDVRPDRQNRAGDRRDRRHRRRRLRARCMRRARRSRSPARGARCSMRSPANSKERVHVLPCDLADKDAVEALVPSAEEKMEKLDILVANAGITRDNLFVQLKRRGLGPGDRGQSDRDLSARPRGRDAHDAPPLRPHDRHYLGGRRSPAIRGRATTPPPRPA